MKRLLLIALCLLIFPWTPCQSAEPIQLARMNPWVAGSVAAEIGDGIIGGTDNSNQSVVFSGKFISTLYATSTAGNVRYAHILVTTGPATDSTVCLALHTADGTKVLSGSSTLTASTTGWLNIDMGSSYIIANSTNYILSVQTSVAFTAAFGGYHAGSVCTDVAYSTCQAAQVMSCGIDAPEVTVLQSRPLSIIFTNSSGDPI